MQQKKAITNLSLLIAILSIIATLTGIQSSSGPGSFEYETIRGETILIYGQGIYKHMSAEVAIQGIAQDYVTLFAGVPLLLLSLFYARRGSCKGRYMLAGTLGYFFVSYLFYLVMGMYNYLFLVYVALTGASFFALTFTLFEFTTHEITERFAMNTPAKPSGVFLMFSAVVIGLLWLSIVVPPLISGSIYPTAVEHYTTLIVQGLDLSLLLPISFYSGLQLSKKKPLGYIIAPVFLIFLTFMMTALVAKIIYMGIEGYNIIPVIFIIPVFAVVAGLLAFQMVKSIKPSETVL